MKTLATATLLILAAVCPTRANQYAIPFNTVECSDFQKLDQRSWRALRNVTVRLSASMNMPVKAGNVVKGAYVSSDGQDLFDTLQMKCS